MMDEQGGRDDVEGRMIDKSFVKSLVDQWLEDKEYFLTDLTVSPDDRIVVEIDHEEGVWIEDCVELSRFIEVTARPRPRGL